MVCGDSGRVRSVSMNEISKIIDIAVNGLSGPSAAREIADRLKALAGLSGVDVDPKAGRIRFRIAANGANGYLQKALDEIKTANLIVPTHHEEVDIFDMRCAACVSSLENGLHKIPGIADAQINFATQTGRIELVDGVYDRRRLLDDIKKIGYEAAFHIDDGDVVTRKSRLKRDLVLSLACTAIVFILHMGEHVAHLWMMPAAISAIAQFALTLPVLYAGRMFFADAVVQLRHRRANMNTLIALGSGTAFVYSLIVSMQILSGHPSGHTAIYFETTVMIISFILIGRYLEEKATQEARNAAIGMASLIPSRALRLADGREEEIDVGRLMISDVVIVRPGAAVPADGIVVEGETAVDESLITGESLPVAKKAGDAVTGGTVNISHGIRMAVTRVGSGTVLGRMVRMVREAQNAKAPIQRLADRVAAVFVPMVILIALATLIVWAVVSPESGMALTAPVAVLLVACPCAMGLATPTAILVGTGRAARMGILFRNGEILEKLSKVSTFVFDKTGTLTEGRPAVSRFIPAEGVAAETLLQYAASAEQLSEHPFGKAIRTRARKDGIKLFSAANHRNQPGQGLTAEVDGKTAVVGNRVYVSSVGLSAEYEAAMKHVEKEEGTAVVYVAVDGRYLGAISLADTLKDGAAETIRQLNHQGLETLMLTGDNAFSASAVATKLGISRVEADAGPEMKLTTIRSLSQTGRVTAMIGDGVNDAAALAAADIGISLGTGTDIAVKASDITITGKSLAAILTAVDVSKATLRIIKQNLFWAFFYNVIMIPVAAGALYPIFGLLFSPIWAAAAMALSSVFVVTNSLRLRKLQPAVTGNPD